MTVKCRRRCISGLQHARCLRVPVQQEAPPGRTGRQGLRLNSSCARVRTAICANPLVLIEFLTRGPCAAVYGARETTVT